MHRLQRAGILLWVAGCLVGTASFEQGRSLTGVFRRMGESLYIFTVRYVLTLSDSPVGFRLHFAHYLVGYVMTEPHSEFREADVCGDPVKSPACPEITDSLNLTLCLQADCCFSESVCFRKTLNRTREHVAYGVLATVLAVLIVCVIYLLWHRRQARRRAGDYTKKEVNGMMKNLMAERRGSDIMPYKR